MFFKKTLNQELEVSLEEAKRERIEHQDKMEFHKRMADYFMDREKRLAAELGHDRVREPDYPVLNDPESYKLNVKASFKPT